MRASHRWYFAILKPQHRRGPNAEDSERDDRENGPSPSERPLRRMGFGRPAVSEIALQGRCELRHIGVPPGVTELRGIAPSQCLQVRRQLLFARHRRPLHQHGNDRDVPPQRGGYFQPNEVLRGVETPSPVLVGGMQPVPADQRQQHVAGADMLIDAAAKVAARLDAGNVDEDAILAETRLQTLEQATGLPLAIIASVTDEDARH